ncbi:ankyrin [Ephemerocybe angulata]|uniref:Ankyrin n=1 Tax=Ephemerocybe angulata TaxID=980116 RepID=A0A8H6HPF0_9AGAR|nr:ankyrin [Tulosesus angulatus]
MSKNIWVAAGDGDLARVTELVEQHGLSPNGPDENSYTPMHAAASYGHLHVLEYLISKGGDVNVTDDDGDTPLYTVESIDTAQYLVQHGAAIAYTNREGISPIEHLSEDFPAVAAYLQSASNQTSAATHPSQTVTQPSQHSQNAASEQLTAALMESVRGIMERADIEGIDPDQDLQEAVTRAVLNGVVTGYEMSTEDSGMRNQPPPGADDGEPAKRSRTEDTS